MIRKEVPGRMRLRSHMALGNTTWRLVVTVIVVVTLVRLSYALIWSSQALLFRRRPRSVAVRPGWRDKLSGADSDAVLEAVPAVPETGSVALTVLRYQKQGKLGVVTLA